MEPGGLRQKLAGRLAFGFGISGALVGPLTRKVQPSRIISEAIEGGVTIFDMAPSYGNGRAEEIAGRALGSNADLFVMTKAGVVSSGVGQRQRDFSPQGILQSIEASRIRLNRDAIDLVWLHGPDPDEMTRELFDMLEEIRARGWVHHFGVAGRGEKLRATMHQPVFEAVMLPVHAGLTGDAPMFSEAQQAGKLVAGIEVLTPAANARRGLSPGAVRRALKTLSGRGGNVNETGADLSIEDALRWPLQTKAADFIVSSTTLRRRLRRSLSVLGAYEISASQR